MSFVEWFFVVGGRGKKRAQRVASAKVARTHKHCGNGLYAAQLRAVVWTVVDCSLGSGLAVLNIDVLGFPP